MAGLYTTGLGNANTKYNGGSIPAEIAPPTGEAFPAIVTKDTYIWLDVSYDL